MELTVSSECNAMKVAVEQGEKCQQAKLSEDLTNSRCCVTCLIKCFLLLCMNQGPFVGLLKETD